MADGIEGSDSRDTVVEKVQRPLSLSLSLSLSRFLAFDDKISSLLGCVTACKVLRPDHVHTSVKYYRFDYSIMYIILIDFILIIIPVSCGVILPVRK